MRLVCINEILRAPQKQHTLIYHDILFSSSDLQGVLRRLLWLSAICSDYDDLCVTWSV